jgi:hypothetical protein
MNRGFTAEPQPRVRLPGPPIQDLMLGPGGQSLIVGSTVAAEGRRGNACR